MNVIIVGAGIAGLTLALELHDAGIECQVFEAADRLEPIGVGINVLPHATAVLERHGVLGDLAAAGVTTKESAFFNRFGQFVHREPAGLIAGFSTPQFSIHRGDLQGILAAAVRERLGPDGIVLGHRCVGVSLDEDFAVAKFTRGPGPDGDRLPDQRADLVIACDGIHSVVRRQLHPAEGTPRYSGVMMWRGITAHAPFLSGASMVRIGWLAHGKMVVYPIRDAIDDQGRQLVNWVAELEAPQISDRDWNREGHLEDFIGPFERWRFDWLDVPGLIRGTESILEYPMVDQDPLDHWGVGRVTLLGDAAHPMVPRGSNGAGQAILDARALREALAGATDLPAALRHYESVRLPATSRVVLANRATPPDVLLKEVWERTNDLPFQAIGDVITPDEIRALGRSYEQIAGMSRTDAGTTG